MPAGFEFVYQFNARRVAGDGEMKMLLGGKGAGLAEMCRIGLPVPPGFTISTDACNLFNRDPQEFGKSVWPEVEAALRELEEVSEKRFGALPDPLLLSVRSGARFSMPGMMDSVLNIGLNDSLVEGLIEQRENPEFVYDCYRRLLQMFGDVVLKVPKRDFELILAQKKQTKNVRHEMELAAGDLKQICQEFQAILKGKSPSFPSRPEEQLRLSVEAVFDSWNNPRAITYRRLNDIPEDLGTAVNVQMMVFGNRGFDSGSGVGFTRNPSTGEARLYGEFLPRSQGEEVVAGIRTPLGLERVEADFPEAYRQLRAHVQKLEAAYRDMQDFEFTIERNRLFMLQTRTGKRTGLAAVRIAWEMHQERLISRDEALLRVSPDQLKQLLHPRFKREGREALARGLPASPGAAVGRIVFSADDAVRGSRRGNPVILVRPETTPDDIHGMHAAEGVLTARGGMTSHAAVVARGMGKCCVVGCESLYIEEGKKELQVGKHVLREGDFLSLDGNSGEVFSGQLEKVETDPSGGLLANYLSLLEDIPALGVRVNADTAQDARKARELGAVGIGLCRTEHMFFEQERLHLMQDMLLAESDAERDQALARLREFQKLDFMAILAEMDGLPVTVRLLDPPLHEFLPAVEELQQRIAQSRDRGSQQKDVDRLERLLERTFELKEFNPMLGHRGCRLGVSYPEITRMQSRALLEAACEVKKGGGSPTVEVMIPLVSMVEEFRHQAALIREEAEQVFEYCGLKVPLAVGTMIELPRAALLADELARESEFFSFGTNDLTQTTFGFSRDDSGKFIRTYREKNILRQDPFESLDLAGVGQLIRMAVERGRKSRPDLKIGICGEHGGDPASVRFCHQIGMDYVSCSPYRIPLARLAAAQAAIGTQPDETR